MLDLLDYRRRVSELYRDVRERGNDAHAWELWRATRDELFRSHPSSALDDGQKADFAGLPYFDYDPEFRVVVPVDRNVKPDVIEYEAGEDGLVRYQRFGRASFELPNGMTGELSLFWILGYGGGVFVPFGDATNKGATYGGGRYLYDTIKGADIGTTLTEIVFDFNFAYNPSCAYNPRWVCPLAPLENRLDFAVTVGERRFL